MSEELYRRRRPTEFSQMVGQDESVKMLVEFGKRKSIPHCLLFTGPSGSGKTTTARILRVKMKCGDHDYQELNTADFRGIDMVREIRSRMNLAPMSGKVRIWLVDECFAAGTMVETEKGPKPIEDVRKGDQVFSIDGLSRVEETFVNRVALDRIVRLQFDDGTLLTTTRQHTFLTDEGWVESQNFDTKFCILSNPCIGLGLESRHGLSSCRIGDRGKWENALIEKGYIDRCKENPTSRVVRVVSVEVYQPGINDQSFRGVVKDRDRNRGFVEFYDLQVAGHPSYFAGGLPVHNCHKLTGDAQNAFLKMLEDPPDHVYFMLATTDPQKLLPTIRTRATEIKLKPLKSSDMSGLINDMHEQECGSGINEDVCDKIVDLADGSPRKAMVLLNQVLGLGDVEAALAVLSGGVAEQEGIDLARMLLNANTSWPLVAKTLKVIPNLETGAEGIRRLILAYMSSVALGGGKGAARAIDVIDCFRSPYYDTGKAGLVLSCWDAINTGK